MRKPPIKTRKRVTSSDELLLLGPAPNPFKRLRLQHNITLDLMAHKSGVSKQALIRLEQGTFADPLPTVLNYFSQTYTETELELSSAYSNYQAYCRRGHDNYFGSISDCLHPDFLDSAHLSDCHPFRLMRASKNPTVVAKDLCIPHATITYFERNVVQQKSVPKVIVSVLFEIGYSSEEVITLLNAYEQYRNAVLIDRVSKGKRTEYGYVSTRK